MRRGARALAAGTLTATLATACVGPPGDPGPTGARPTTRGPTTSVSSSPAGPTAGELLRDPELATTHGGAALRRAVRQELDVAGGWDERMATDLAGWPVYVGDARVGLDGGVELDLAVDVPAEADGELVLRWLPAATALGDVVDDLDVRVDGEAVEVTVDRPGARILVPVPAGDPTTVRVRAAYEVPDRPTLVDDGSPAGTGLLARTEGLVALGHWLPLVTLGSDDGPMVARGDVGAFPAAAFSVQVRHDGTLVSGGQERPCPDRAACTWLRGAGLRDVSAVLLGPLVSAADAEDGPTDVVVHAREGSDPAEVLAPVAREAAEGLDVLTASLGPLAWPAVDVVAVPLGPGALGMEFPGMVWVDPSAWPEDGGPGLGSYVLAHELAHQWFHALVGNGSLTAPVVDESLAQYLSVVVFDAIFGGAAGDELAASSLGGRHRQALDAGVVDDPPAQPLSDFSSDRSYGAAVYGRAGQAWVDAEAAVGRDVLLAALRELVTRHGLREVDERVVLELVAELAPGAVEHLVAGWGLPAVEE